MKNSSDFECPRCGHCCKTDLARVGEVGVWGKELEKEPLYWSVATGWVYADDISQDHVDETVKCKHEPVAEIQAEDMGKPFNAIRVTVHFYAEVPAVGTKLYKAPPKRELTCVCGAVWEGEMMVHPPRKAAEWFDCTDAQLMDEVRRRGFVIRDAQIDPVKREWVGLTDDERREIFDACETTDRGYVLAMVEAKLKEKNKW
jgi:hypothetical protein